VGTANEKIERVAPFVLSGGLIETMVMCPG